MYEGQYDSCLERTLFMSSCARSRGSTLLQVGGSGAKILSLIICMGFLIGGCAYGRIDLLWAIVAQGCTLGGTVVANPVLGLQVSCVSVYINWHIWNWYCQLVDLSLFEVCGLINFCGMLQTFWGLFYSLIGWVENTYATFASYALGRREYDSLWLSVIRCMLSLGNFMLLNWHVWICFEG